MTRFIDQIKARFRLKLTTERRAAPRFTTHLERRLVVNVSLLDMKTDGSRGPTVLAGFTRDVSESGLGIVLPDIRIGKSSVTRPDKTLRIMLGLPGEPIEIHALPVRHVEVDEGGESEGYLVGVRITEMSERDRSRYQEFLKTLSIKE
ncbi:MAG TPA: PilZ domain-containing protein [Pyrinomonadaceae bacterium]|nr:PilZ domain-containing protein [Pyrinomonadaceae bacterium]